MIFPGEDVNLDGNRSENKLKRNRIGVIKKQQSIVNLYEFPWKHVNKVAISNDWLFGDIMGYTAAVADLATGYGHQGKLMRVFSISAWKW